MKPIFVFPYHDPQKEYNKVFEDNLLLLKDIFSKICISVTPATVDNNAHFLSWLENEGCFVYKNGRDTTIGDHFRNALKIGLEKCQNPSNYFYFGFLDRVLCGLETKLEKAFIKDIKAGYKEDLVIFARSDKAWHTHPKEYYDLEKIITDAGRVFIKKDLDWIWCGALIKENLARIILNKSRINNFAVLAEFITIAYRENKLIRNKAVDWLIWEDPFWARRNKQSKPSRRMTENEKKFRLDYCLDALKLFT